METKEEEMNEPPSLGQKLYVYIKKPNISVWLCKCGYLFTQDIDYEDPKWCPECGFKEIIVIGDIADAKKTRKA